MRRLALMLCALACAPTLRAASFAVDRLDDAVDMLPGDGVCLAIGGGCTLRAAIQESNALAGPDTLQLAAGTHLLTLPGIDEDLSSQGDLDVTDALTIEGAGPLVTVIDGGALDRVLDVLPADSARAVALRDLSLRNGRLDSFSQNSGGGAGLRVGRQVQLLIERVDIRNNVSSTFVDAMGLSNRGCINGQRLRLLDNFDPDQTGNERARAGAIYTSGVDSCLSLSDSEIRGNQGDQTGAVYADDGAPITLSRSLVADNEGRATGAFLLNNNNEVLMDNVTISGNRGNGAVLVDGGATLTLRNSTVTRNVGSFGQPVVGGIHDVHSLPGRTFISNTILSGNGPGALGDECRVVRSLDGGNILGDSSRCQHQLLPSDQVDVDPGLGPLADHGGWTHTHLPGPNAIDRGVTSACLAEDQRGVTRPQDGDGDGLADCDVGATEWVDPTALFADGFE
ncbi:MAG: right-handed parallel beta-helix repeat-containing protein [Lysobacterales bacterium]